MELFRVISFGVTKGFSGFSVAAFLMLASFCVFADETGKEHEHEVSEAHKNNVEKMLVLMNIPAQVDKSAEGVVQRYSATVDPTKANADVQKLVAAYQKDLEQIILPTLSWSGLKTTYIYSYSTRLNEKEVEQITNFYSSEAGKKFIAIQPDSTKEIQKITAHLVESDIEGPLDELANLLRDGLQKQKVLNASEQKTAE